MKNNMEEIRPAQGEPSEEYEKKEGELRTFPKTKEIEGREAGMIDQKIIEGKIEWFEKNEPNNPDLAVFKAFRESFKGNLDSARRDYQAWIKAKNAVRNAQKDLETLEEQIIGEHEKSA